MSYIDFAEVKKNHPVEKVAERLGIELKKNGNSYRANCPACNSEDKRNLAITPSKGAWYCFEAQEGGDCIKLVQHVNGLDAKAAALWIAGDTATQPKKAATQEPKERRGFTALDYLEADHPAVEAVGFTAEDASRLGAGFAPRGVMRGTVAVPIRDTSGKLLGYIGLTDATLPSTWHW